MHKWPSIQRWQCPIHNDTLQIFDWSMLLDLFSLIYKTCYNWQKMNIFFRIFWKSFLMLNIGNASAVLRSNCTPRTQHFKGIKVDFKIFKQRALFHNEYWIVRSGLKRTVVWTVFYNYAYSPFNHVNTDFTFLPHHFLFSL